MMFRDYFEFDYFNASKTEWEFVNRKENQLNSSSEHLEHLQRLASLDSFIFYIDCDAESCTGLDSNQQLSDPESCDLPFYGASCRISIHSNSKMILQHETKSDTSFYNSNE